jgi:hypothetical protein
MPQFHIKSAYDLPDRRAFALSGRIIEGEIRVGMFVDFIRGVSCQMGPIHSIEVLGHGAAEDMCLLFKYENETELSLWRLLTVQDELVSVFESHEIGGID